MGDSHHLWVLGIICGRWVVVRGLGCRLQVVGFVRVVRLSIAGSGVRSHGRVVHACWFVIRGHGGDVACAGWSLLARLDGMRVGVLTMNNSMDIFLKFIASIVPTIEVDLTTSF